MCISKLKNKTRFNLSAGIGHFKDAHYIAAFFPKQNTFDITDPCSLKSVFTHAASIYANLL